MFSKEELDAEIAAGNINAQTSTVDDYTIYNYSAQAQYEYNWNDVTLQCRGLILDPDLNVVARPFGKFFNYTERPTPNEALDRRPTLTQEKVDGSLGIIYPSKEGYRVATRGSFHSNQAEWATEWLNTTFPGFIQPEGVTTLVEIIYPENRIVVDYKGEKNLVLLTAIDNNTGADISPEEIDWWEGIRCREWSASNIEEAYRLATSNEFNDQEGLVCTWFKYGQPSLRLKIKHPEYVRLHRIMTNFSEKALWEALSEGVDFLAMLDSVPDEFYTEISEKVSDYIDRYNQIDVEIDSYFQDIKHLPRKQFAEEAKKKNYASALFSMYDGKNHSNFIWKQLKPKAE